MPSAKRTRRDWDDPNNNDLPPPLRSASSASVKQKQPHLTTTTATTFIGTEQPSLDLSDVKNKDKNKYLPLHLQEVRDEKGRKRLHGAFTGGFSAGYYNTVGSKEGWQPQQFKSSRDERAKAAALRPQDFMDDEDLQELADTKKIAATQGFDILGGTERDVERRRAAAASQQNESAVGPLPTKVIGDLIGPSSDPIGMKLLRQMGWREGQGVGARLFRKPTDTSDDVYAANISFAPKDTSLVPFDQKTNVFGLGYNPHENAKEFALTSDVKDASDDSLELPDKGSFAIKGGFGTGLFDDNDLDEDIDVYDSRKTAYTLVMDDDEEDFDVATIKKRLQALENEKRTKSTKKSVTRNSISVPEPLRQVTIQLCHDGKPPLRGFVLANNPPPLSKWFQSPQMPADFIPIHDFDAPGPRPDLKTEKPRPQSELTADQRRDILGEKPLDGPSRSVFEFMPLKSQDRLLQFLDSTTSSNSQLKKDQHEKQATRDIPTIEKSAAEAALKGFMPFGNDAGKQARYKRFLEVYAGLEQDLLKPPQDMHPRDAHHELVEFAKAAQIFQPLSATMASRFTTASSMSTAAAQKDIEPQTEPPKKPHIITRSVESFYPNKLLCKRFNVPNPYPNREQDTSAGDPSKDVLNQDIMDELIRERDMSKNQQITSLVTGSTHSELLGSEKLLADVSTSHEKEADVDVELEAFGGTGAADEEPERPPMDIFKAIFDSDDDDDDEEEENKHKNDGHDVDDSSNVHVERREDNIVADVADLKPSKILLPSVLSKEFTQQPFRPVFVRKENRNRSATIASSKTKVVLGSAETIVVETPPASVDDVLLEIQTASALSKVDGSAADSSKQVHGADSSDESSDDDSEEKRDESLTVSSSQPRISVINDEAERERKRLKKEAKKAKKRAKKDKKKKHKKEKKKRKRSKHESDGDNGRNTEDEWEVKKVKVDHVEEKSSNNTVMDADRQKPNVEATGESIPAFKRQRPRAVDYM
ncbi:hypothetical protein SeMB42_g06433 [Synchytrium endobioticum]|uniref:G-patch domain-containing protein n=1 Tax=Synchytrium endobioticum TaxID=286115 RepID=A0A507D3T3_9FUNG|nr:hypothetical protein SeMB42_g06433 [Synchytrium endobioticum]TPX45918.1 hypothetical protein SeLEV6574_g03546 [Synchytrium endobioticum]